MLLILLILYNWLEEEDVLMLCKWSEKEEDALILL